MKKCLLVLTGALLYAGALLAQPANDMCSGAIELTIYATEAEATPVEGDTRNTVDALNDNIPVCSANFYRDDVWYYVDAPVDPAQSGYAVKVYFGEDAEDVDSFGIALYSSCDTGATNQPIFCANSPGDDRAVACLSPMERIYIRVWGQPGGASDWQTGQGTFRIVVFENEFEGGEDMSVVLWGDETGQGDFAGGLGDWTPEGLQCAQDAGGNPVDGSNALWEWTPSGFPFYVFGPYGGISSIKSRSACNGSAIFDSGFLEFGETGGAGTGPCPWDVHEGSLVSPVIDISESAAAGVSVLFNQSMQRFAGGQHFLDFSTDGGANWTEIEINTEKSYLSTNPATGEGYYNEEYRVRLPGAAGSDQLRIRFRFLGGAYWWVIDDVRIVETQCIDMRSNSNFYAIAPAAQTPASQLRPWFPLNDIENVGACDQENVSLNCRIENSEGVAIYDEDLAYGTIAPDSVAENVNFDVAVDQTGTKDRGMFSGRYLVTSDSATMDKDFNFENNSNTFNYFITDTTMALDAGFTRSLAPATGNWDPGAPWAWVYGCYYYFPAGNGWKLNSVTWGAANPADVANTPISIILYKWIDANADEIVQAAERSIEGFAEVIFDGTEPDDLILNTPLDNFFNPGEDILFEDDAHYLIVMQFNAQDQTQFFVLASEDYDYAAINLGMTQAGTPTYASVLGLPGDGIVEGIEYGLGLNSATTFGFDIVPMMQLNIGSTSATNDLSSDNFIQLFPNPASDLVNVNMEFTQRLESVELTIIDASGKRVFVERLKDIENAILEFDVRKLVPGSYMMHVNTSAGMRTLPFVVQH